MSEKEEKQEAQEQDEEQANNNNNMEDSDDEDEGINQQAREALLQHILRNVFHVRTNSETNEDLVKHLQKSGLLKNERIIKAMLAIPRGLFVTDDVREEAYIDTPLRLAKHNFNFSAPHMYAMCLENLDIQPGHTVLDIGSGTGHFTALAAFLSGPNGFAHGVDLFQYIIDFAESNIKKVSAVTGIQFTNLKFFVRNCFLPAIDEVKYDRIHVGACCPEGYLTYLYDLLKPEGILVTPFGDRLMKAIKNKDGTFTTTSLLQVRYSDLILPSETEIKEAKKVVARERAKRITVPESNYFAQIKELLNNPHLSDITFNVEGKKIYCHKFILQLRSEHFQGMFSSGMKESSATELNISEFTYEPFMEMIKFVYTDDCVLTPDNCVLILELANYYKLDRLKAMCEYRLHLDVDTENVASFLMVADRFNAQQLRSFCLQYILDNIKDVIKTKAFNELDRDLINSILIQSVGQNGQ
jgi:protein-L-isoaspartate(D-aspartate) O-methyltransferase